MRIRKREGERPPGNVCEEREHEKERRKKRESERETRVRKGRHLKGSLERRPKKQH